MGLFSGTTTTKTNETANSGPSTFQAPYLTSSFDAAKNIYDTSKDTPYYQGATYAGMTQEAKDALAKLKGYAGATGLDNATTMSSIGSTAGGYAGSAGSAIDKLSSMAGTDPTQANITAATAYANNPATDALIDANSRDVVRNLSESALPSIDRAASAGGNLNSSRAGVAAGIAQRGAADRIGDISAQIRSDAYDRGLSLAENARSTNMSSLNAAGGQYSNLTGLGLDALGRANSTAYGAYDAINGANAQEQADTQGQLDADKAKWEGQDTRASDLLARYNSIVGANQWGQSSTSSGTSKQKGSASVLSQLAGAAATAGSIYAGFKVPGKK